MEITVIIKGATSLEEIRQALNAEIIQGARIEPEETTVETETQAGGGLVPIAVEIPENEAETGKKPLRYRSRRKVHHYSQEENTYITTLYDNGVDYGSITSAFNKRFGTSVTVQAIRQRLRALGK